MDKGKHAVNTLNTHVFPAFKDTIIDDIYCVRLVRSSDYIDDIKNSKELSKFLDGTLFMVTFEKYNK